MMSRAAILDAWLAITHTFVLYFVWFWKEQTKRTRMCTRYHVSAPGKAQLLDYRAPYPAVHPRSPAPAARQQRVLHTQGLNLQEKVQTPHFCAREQDSV